MHDAIVARVQEMLDWQTRLSPIRHIPCDQRDEILHEIERVDQQIDQLVYDLYELTQSERHLVENID